MIPIFCQTIYKFHCRRRTLKTSIKTTEVPNNKILYYYYGDDIDSDDVIGGNLTDPENKNGKLI